MNDIKWMSRALQLAQKGRYTARPNPCVGCVLVSTKDNTEQVIGEGWHYRAGEPHAEVNAIADAKLYQRSTSNSTAYVTLEPCNHTGKTGPCSKALIAAGVSRVVYGMKDPNPLVAGSGLETLLGAGIIVDGPVLEEQAYNLNQGFIGRMLNNRPRVRCKIASSLDGRTAMANGESQWITGAQARADVQKLRAASCAIVSGIGSVLQDNSRLTLRDGELKLLNIQDVMQNPPIRVLLDASLKIPLDAAILSPDAKTLMIVSEQTYHDRRDKIAQLIAMGDHISLESVPIDGDGKLSLERVLAVLANRGCNEILIESGSKLAGAFLQQDLVDELIVYQAPVFLGHTARQMFDLPLEHMSQKRELEVIDRRQLGEDTRIIARLRCASRA